MGKQKILVGSGNKKKLAELAALSATLPIEILTPADLPDGLPEVDEDKDSFVDNAMKKARAFAEAAAEQLGEGIWALADDSGLMVDALEGAPGVHSARYAGECHDLPAHARDLANNNKLLEAMQFLGEGEREAAFKCVIAVADSKQPLFAVEGLVAGCILTEPDGEDGFGYDPLFYHEGSGKTFARLSAAEKAAISHRGQAMARLQVLLESVL
ncbi:MAG: RdgB/HAM1 family non-canonical purine NTP pyrophosphatase [Planctomycetes bacterium]|jgi:XTP/dITP diphosphohydrolase|nr:RdgB/HAM1 family non-canonical purine NTP pyrophosphatase [Planctomycetota bacterium]MBT4029108.1 RdgB/HAM1 family non-canonical purine NTP pyrophosphatase [Planctomycetota bacterium]MBT4560486.1 RdgB/HAM1 family non-canonical purine NTP pyrophosphatase [Planctomycetota bacterium]MBT5102155.1 RdgB/HAM1 family non-canonical purine NTP pyrophosphatase [Planctomycetota bacterium]MBT5119422.1 RdgB/HAM1 family non-canonical purine NTP pyrophosphatase [Planctomycetota bacterium]